MSGLVASQGALDEAKARMDMASLTGSLGDSSFNDVRGYSAFAAAAKGTASSTLKGLSMPSGFSDPTVSTLGSVGTAAALEGWQLSRPVQVQPEEAPNGIEAAALDLSEEKARRYHWFSKHHHFDSSVGFVFLVHALH